MLPCILLPLVAVAVLLAVEHLLLWLSMRATSWQCRHFARGQQPEHLDVGDLQFTLEGVGLHPEAAGTCTSRRVSQVGFRAGEVLGFGAVQAGFGDVGLDPAAQPAHQVASASPGARFGNQEFDQGGRGLYQFGVGQVGLGVGQVGFKVGQVGLGAGLGLRTGGGVGVGVWVCGESRVVTRSGGDGGTQTTRTAPRRLRIVNMRETGDSGLFPPLLPPPPARPGLHALHARVDDLVLVCVEDTAHQVAGP